jgi:glutathione S-transferase
MKLHYSPDSQFVRKVIATAIETGLLGKIEMINDKKDLEKHNPLLKRPTLITDEGDCILDSPVICEYLDSLHNGRKLVPVSGRARWKALSQEALADGIMDAAGNIRQDENFHKESPSKPWHERQMLKVVQGMDAFEAEAKKGAFDGEPTIGTLTIAICCGYLGKRFPELERTKSRPALAKWYEAFAKRPSMTQSAPKAHA